MNIGRHEFERLAHPGCASCAGSGLRKGRGGLQACRCALRGMFRACHARFRACAENGKYRSRVTYEKAYGGRNNRAMWGRKEEEFIADFELVSRRVLDPWHYKIFRWHFLLGADSKLICRRLGIGRGTLFHAVYRVEALLGAAFVTLRPYALYPPRDYFTLQSTVPVKALASRPAARAVAPRVVPRLTVAASLERRSAA